jgi:cyclic beta-1,2-glucan synthetase
VTGYVEWVLGAARGAAAPFIVTERDRLTGALLARNPWSLSFSGRVAFADLGGRQKSWTADRTEFIGRNGGPDAPAALDDNAAPLSGTAGGGHDPCAALQDVIDLPPGAEVDMVFIVGQGRSLIDVQALVNRYRTADLDDLLRDVEAHWRTVLGAAQVKTPDRSMDIMMNGWLLYQTLACRIWARSAFYQSSGAYGFRDQLQDGMALTMSLPDVTRGHILRAAGRQFVEGDVQHWWLPESGQGVRTRITDDRVWLAFATATYIRTSGDAGILDEMVPFLDGPPLAADEQDAFFLPSPSDETATLFEHCARALDQALGLIGEHGLPLIGTGDWNDGMNMLGPGGKGESVWLGWLMVRTIDIFLPYAKARAPDRATGWRTGANAIRNALERDAWDGQWYRRATFDDGTWLGSKENSECRIDSIAQSWAVLSGVARPSRGALAMQSLDRHLIDRQADLALLFAPPFDKTALEPGYIKGYPPGVRENGGQYSHAAMWAILAFTSLGEGNKAGELFAMVNPVNHALTAADVARYKVEPYVVAADIYAAPDHMGRGGWTWYTGSAGWMYQAGLHGILGIRRDGNRLVVDPCMPSDWPGYEVNVSIGTSRYRIEVDNPSRRCRGVSAATLDGAVLAPVKGSVRLALDGKAHDVRVTI